jgi:hypothetical protein
MSQDKWTKKIRTGTKYFVPPTIMPIPSGKRKDNCTIVQQFPRKEEVF